MKILNNSTYDLPIFMAIDDGAICSFQKDINKLVSNCEILNALILTSEFLENLYPYILDMLRNTFCLTHTRYIAHNSFDFSVDIAKYICTDGINIVIGFGGGAILDVAKYAAFVSKTCYVALPTVLSNDGLVSPISVLYANDKRKKSFGAKIPDGIIIDTAIIAKAPQALLEAGVGDTLSNYTALYDWNLACEIKGESMNDFAYMLSEMSFLTLLHSQDKSVKSFPCLKNVAQSLVLSGLAMQIAGNSRPCSGSEHLFSHAVDELYDIAIPHGILVALGSIVSCTLQGRDKSIILDYIKGYRLTLNPLKLGLTKENFVNAWMYAKTTRKERFTVLNTKELTASKFEKIYDELVDEMR